MSKLMSLIRRAPKRFSAVVTMAIAAVVVPAVVLAWGPERPTFTGASPAPYVTFNSITDNPQVGDERNFVRIRESGTTTYGDNTTLTPGKVYDVSVYYHNNAASNLNASGAGIAHGAMLKMEVPGVVNAGVNAAFTGTISASNSKPLSVWDEAYGKNDTNGQVALRYVSGSAKFVSNGAINGQTLPDTLFTTGANLGYDSQNGDIPGCNQYSGYVNFQIRVDQPNFTVKKQVSVDDGKTWVDDSVKATAGSTILYRIVYQNTGSTQQDNVSIRDTLPAKVSYVTGSSLIANSTTDGQYKSTLDGVTTVGYNAGSYQPQGNAYLKFSAKLPTEDQLECGTNTLVNTARVTTNAGYKEDTATVTIDKTCKPTVKYTCDALNVITVDKTHFKFNTTYTAENATFKSVTYVVKNAAGAVVDTKTSTSTSLDYTQATVGKYTVQATVTFTVDGQDKTATSEGCKGMFEVKETPPVVKYTCDALNIMVVDRTHFTFTTTYTAQNATFKGVTYTIKDASGKIVDTITATGTSSNYTQTTAGKYTVEAAVIFNVNGQDKTVTSQGCAGMFEVPSLPNNITVCELATKTIVTINEKDFNTDKYSKDLSKCASTPVVPPVTPPVTPPELPHTGMTENIVAIVGLGAIVASVAYYIASRRALNQ